MKIKRGDIIKIEGFKSLFEVVRTGIDIHIVTGYECYSEWQVSKDDITLVCKRENREDLK